VRHPSNQERDRFSRWERDAFSRAAGFTKGLVASLALVVAIVAVGLTASPEAPFSIALRPVFLRLGVDVDVKLGSMHLHASWSALPDASTKAEDETF
jgi:hypothetical protein